MEMGTRTGKRDVRIIVMAGVLIFGLMSAGQAQDAFSPNFEWMDESDPRYYENVIDRHEDMIEQELWADLFEILIDQARNSAVNWTGAEEVQASLIGAFEATIQEISIIDSQFNGEYRSNLSQLNTGRFREGTTLDGFVVFNGISPSIVIYREGANTDVSQNNQPEYPPLTEAQAEDFRYRAKAADELMEILLADADEIIVDAIETSYKKWNNFLDNGFVMYPWEISLNSALLKWDIQSPPSTQFIFLHPSLGIQVPLDGFSDPVKFRAKESLVIEVAGHLWYRGEFLENYAGVSGTVVLREDLPPGIGVLVRPGRGLAAGLNWHLSASDQKTFMKTPFVTVSVNVLNLTTSNRGRFDL